MNYLRYNFAIKQNTTHMNALQKHINDPQQKQLVACMEGDSNDFIRTQLPGLLTKEEYPNWNDLHVLYHEPRVERLFRDIEINGRKYRACLHRIHGVADPMQCLMHYHEWPAITTIIKGSYEMGSGYGDPFGLTPQSMMISHYHVGSSYMMPDPYWWHYVRPTGEASWSVMLMAPKYPKELLPPPSEEHDLSQNKRISDSTKSLLFVHWGENIHEYLQNH